MHKLPALLCASFTLAALWTFSASAELPKHPLAAHLGPTAAESRLSTDPEFPFPLQNPDFGAAVAIRNGIAFVGMPSAFPTARVAVYGLTSSGWVRNATIAAADPGFGRALAFRDGVAVIGSNSFLHVFRRSNGVWTQMQKLGLPPDPGPATFDFWKISAMHYENGILGVGLSTTLGDSQVQVYELAATGKFVKRATLRAPGGSPRFGAALGIAGNTLVVGGAHNAAYVFRRQSDGTWLRTQKLIGADSTPIFSFGAAVAIDQGLLIVGAPDTDCLDGSGLHLCASESPDSAGAGGAAYGFVPINGQYVQVFKLRPGALEHSNYFKFGRRIAMMGKYVVIDAAVQQYARDPDISPPNILGLSFTYARDGSNLTPRGLTRGYITSDSLGLANNWLLIGATHDLGIGCIIEFSACAGEGMIFDLSRFVQ